MFQITTLDIASIIHEANRACGEVIGEPLLPWDEAPEYQRTATHNGVLMYIDSYAAGVPVTPSMSHQKWMEGLLADGWEWGLVKDQTLKQHPCLVEYDELPVKQRLKDSIMDALINQFLVQEWHGFIEIVR